ncbi:MAG: L-serine ammonia-lyase, iron-sulfur-dependent, subunit alpha [Clostridiaceae bacterium]
MDKSLLIRILKKEMEQSTGCTDPGAVCLAVSRAAREMKKPADKVKITVSPNVYKNGVCVGIPGTGKQGLHMAAALGLVIDRSEAGLAILSFVTPETIDEANRILASGNIRVDYMETPDPLYIKAELFNDQETASTLIMNDYSNITEVTYNGNIILSSSSLSADETEDYLKEYSLELLFKVIDSMSFDDLKFLLDYALMNKTAAETGLHDENMKLGSTLKEYAPTFKAPYSIVNKAQTLTAAAGEARMQGLLVPIMAIAGSGNHGITNFLGVLAVAEDLGSTEEQLAKALAISSTVTIYIKGYIRRMTAFCGCAVAAATGVAAATVYLLGGTYEQSVDAMQTEIGTLAGMFCDGAKESCAYKLSTATSMAIQFAYLAMNGCHITSGAGIVGNTIEDTFYNLGQLNNPGMVETDHVIVKLIERNFKR